MIFSKHANCAKNGVFENTMFRVSPDRGHQNHKHGKWAFQFLKSGNMFELFEVHEAVPKHFDMAFCLRTVHVEKTLISGLPWVKLLLPPAV